MILIDPRFRATHALSCVSHTIKSGGGELPGHDAFFPDGRTFAQINHL